MKIPFLATLISCALFLFACSDPASSGSMDNSGTSDPQPGSTPAATHETTSSNTPNDPVEAIPLERNGSLKQTDYEHIEPAIADDIRKLEKLYDRAPYYFQHEGNRWFYVANGDWKHSYEREFKQKGAKMGILDGDMQEVLPVAYDKLYNPDGTAEGFIEIENQGKRGLFGYKNKVIIPCSFDLIFPTDSDEAIAIGKSGGSYSFLHEDGRVEPVKTDADIPRYADLGKKLKFDYLDNNISELVDSYHEYYKGDPASPKGLKFLPSYLHALGFIPESMDIAEGNEEFRVTEARGEVNEVETTGDGVSALITSFYEEGIDARGYQIEKSHLVTVDQDNNVFSVVELGDQYPNSAIANCGKDEFKYRFIEGNLLETLEVESIDGYESKGGMGQYRYYEILADGSVKKLVSDRVFPCTEFVKMTETHFEICWTAYVTPKNEDEWGTADDDGNLLVGNHLQVEDLDIMRNEIYASYGYKFTKSKWQKYFGEKKWYKPRFDNVEDKLTEIDRHNIDLILQVKKKMQESPEDYPQPERIWYVAAG